jgi:Ca2+-binding EF-hand superfamily protein
MRKLLKSLLASSAVAILLHSGQAMAQDQGDFIRRMDTNGNGMIDPDESQGRARGMLERMAQSNPRINLSRPIPVEMLSREMERVRGGSSGNNGGRGGGRGGQGGGGAQGGGFGGFAGGVGGSFFGGGQNENERGGGRNRRQNGVDAAGNPVPTLLEGFGNEYNDLPVLGFGADQEANLTGIKTTDDDTNRMERTLRQNDRNGDGVIEGEEMENGRWDDGNPKQYDANRDGRLTKNELLLRAARKRVADEAEEKAEREQRNREREQRGGGDRGGGDRGGGRFGGMFGGGMGGGGWPGGGFGGGGFGGGADWQGRGGGWPGMGGDGGMGRFGGGPPGGMRFGVPGGDPNAMGGPPGGMAITMGPSGGGDGGGREGGGRGRDGGGRGDRGNGGDSEQNRGEQGRGGPGGGGPSFGGGGPGGGDFGGGRGRNWGGGDDNNDPAARIEGYFKNLDKNQSGSLEKEEWEGLTMVRGEDLDKDGSGAISKQEYMEVVGKRMGIEVDPAKYAWRPSGPVTYRARDTREKNPEVPAWFWNEDKNGDGQISMAERSTNWTDERLARWMKEDTNGDGMLSMKEAVASLRPAATGIVVIPPKTANGNGDSNNVASDNSAPQSEQRGEGNRSRNNENNQPGPRIDIEEVREMKADRSQRWNNATSGNREGGAAAPSSATSTTELPDDLPADVDKGKAQRSLKFFNQSDKNKDGFLTTDELDDAKEADKDNDSKASLKEWIIYKN